MKVRGKVKMQQKKKHKKDKNKQHEKDMMATRSDKDKIEIILNGWIEFVTTTTQELQIIPLQIFFLLSKEKTNERKVD